MTTPSSNAASGPAPKSRKSSLTTLDWYRLNRACEPVWDAFGHTYLVGTAATGGDYRDVDVRTILLDEDFDQLRSPERLDPALYQHRHAAPRGDEHAHRLPDPAHDRGQREVPGGNRHPVGMVVDFAGGGDATAFPATPKAEDRDTPTT